MLFKKALFVFFFTLLLSISFAFAAEVTDTLKEASSKTYYLDEIGYFVYVTMIADKNPASVYFEINGKITPELFKGENYTLENNANIFIDEIFLDEGGEVGIDTVTFTLSTDGDEWNYLRILNLDVTINELETINIEDGDEFEAQPGDNLTFSLKIKNLFTKENLSIHNTTAIFTCQDASHFTPTNATILFGELQTQEEKEKTLNISINEDAPVFFETDCEFTLQGTDTFNINREHDIVFDIEILEEPGNDKEICNDNIDNDLDELTDCNDILDCGGECITSLQRENKQQQKEINELQKETTGLRNIVYKLESNVQRIICVIFGCEEK